MRSACSVWLAVLGVGLSAAAANAEMIGVNFVGRTPATETLASAAMAGVVPQANWNNLTAPHGATTTTDTNGGIIGAGTASPVVDDTGAAVGGVTVAAGNNEFLTANGYTPNTVVNQGTTLGTNPGDGKSWGFTGDNATLQLGALFFSPTIIIKDIPYSQYNVFVYFTAQANAGQNGVAISTYDGAPGTVDPTGAYYLLFNKGGVFIRATGTTPPSATATAPQGNYVEFEGNTTRQLELDAINNYGAYATGISGVQIVNTGVVVPEPASMALLGLGVLPLLLRRRRLTLPRNDA